MGSGGVACEKQMPQGCRRAYEFLKMKYWASFITRKALPWRDYIEADIWSTKIRIPEPEDDKNRKLNICPQKCGESGLGNNNQVSIKTKLKESQNSKQSQSFTTLVSSVALCQPWWWWTSQAFYFPPETIWLSQARLQVSHSATQRPTTLRNVFTFPSINPLAQRQLQKVLHESVSVHQGKWHQHPTTSRE